MLLLLCHSIEFTKALNRELAVIIIDPVFDFLDKEGVFPQAFGEDANPLLDVRSELLQLAEKVRNEWLSLLELFSKPSVLFRRKTVEFHSSFANPSTERINLREQALEPFAQHPEV